MSNEISNIRISLIKDLALTIRTKNALINGGVNTVEDLLLYRSSDLLRFRHFGPKALADVHALLTTMPPAASGLHAAARERAADGSCASGKEE